MIRIFDLHFFLADLLEIGEKRALFQVWSICWLGVGVMSKVSLAQLGMNSDVYPREAHRDKSVQRLSPKGEARLWPVVDNEKDYFIER
ncbi:MAG: hypothetical protein HQL34_12510, partial [Alphaproteobacteria bacterium]|nr:hypothetical protein [Alphaproteobacteria bacterium]